MTAQDDRPPFVRGRMDRRGGGPCWGHRTPSDRSPPPGPPSVPWWEHPNLTLSLAVFTLSTAAALAATGALVLALAPAGAAAGCLANYLASRRSC